VILAGLAWAPAGDTAAQADRAQCVRPTAVQRVVFSAAKYPNVRRHFRGRCGAAGRGAWWSTATARTLGATG
jgi:hypothetical protein